MTEGRDLGAANALSNQHRRGGGWAKVLAAVDSGKCKLITPRGILVDLVSPSKLITPRYRRLLYRLAGLNIEGRVSFGVYLGDYDNVRVGKQTYINANCFFDALAPISIGANCLVGMEAIFITSAHEILGPGSYGPPTGQPVSIGDGCWIGARSTVMPGVTICANTVVAAGSVVTSSITVPGVYGGVPARLIRPAAVDAA